VTFETYRQPLASDFTHHCFSAADGSALILDSNTGEKKITLEGEHCLGLNDCCWVDNRLLATASDDNSIVLWDVEMVKHLIYGASNIPFILLHGKAE
jgi:WD40 repeat protein